MSKDNYDKDETISPCEDCIYRLSGEKCKTCKHRKHNISYTQAPMQPTLLEKLKLTYKKQKEQQKQQKEREQEQKETS